MTPKKLCKYITDKYKQKVICKRNIAIIKIRYSGKTTNESNTIV